MKKLLLSLLLVSTSVFGECKWVDPGYHTPEYLRPGRLHERAYWCQSDIFPRTPNGEIDLERMNQMTELKLKMMKTIPCVEDNPPREGQYDTYILWFGIIGFLFIGGCILESKIKKR